MEWGRRGSAPGDSRQDRRGVLRGPTSECGLAARDGAWVSPAAARVPWPLARRDRSALSGAARRSVGPSVDTDRPFGHAPLALTARARFSACLTSTTTRTDMDVIGSRKSWACQRAALVIALVAALGCAAPAHAAQVFAPTSFWNAPAAPAASVATDSDRFVTELQG